MSAGGGWLVRLRAGLTRSSDRLAQSIGAALAGRRLDGEALEALEEALIAGDLGVAAAAELTAELAGKRFDAALGEEEARRFLAGRIAGLLRPLAQPLRPAPERKPHVALVMGVNGTGKTTTVGKLARQFSGAGLRTVLVAGDTFRAAAIEQLRIWGERSGAAVVAGRQGGDAAGLAYGALESAREEGADLLLIDTAGRLHNKDALMAELQKIVRVLGKLDRDAPHDRLLVLDATIGQNAHAQVEAFRAMCGVTGLVVTKLDGSARGGVVVGLAQRFGLPIHAIGVGEGVDDLRPFDADAFARALMGLAPDAALPGLIAGAPPARLHSPRPAPRLPPHQPPRLFRERRMTHRDRRAAAEDNGSGRAKDGAGRAAARILFDSRIVMLFGEIDEKAARAACGQLIAMSEAGADPIRLVISSPGGHVESGDAIHDMIRFVSAPVKTIGTGWVASAGAHIFLAARKENRYCTPNTRFLLHQPMGGIGGKATEIDIEAREILKMRDRLNRIIAEETGQPVERVARDTDRNYWMGPEEARDYGIVAHIVSAIDEVG